MKMESIINEINTDQQWSVIKIEVDNDRVIQMGLTPSKLYRKLSNSKQSFNPLLSNNREYWNNNIEGGYYFSTINEKGNLIMYLFTKTHSQSKTESIRKNLSHRVRHIVNCDFQFGGLEVVPDRLVKTLSTKMGSENLLQPFGKMFGKRTLVD